MKCALPQQETQQEFQSDFLFTLTPYCCFRPILLKNVEARFSRKLVSLQVFDKGTTLEGNVIAKTGLENIRQAFREFRNISFMKSYRICTFISKSKDGDSMVVNVKYDSRLNVCRT